MEQHFGVLVHRNPVASPCRAVNAEFKLCSKLFYCTLISNHNTMAMLSRWETFDLHTHPLHSFVKSPLLSYHSSEMGHDPPPPPPPAFLFPLGKTGPSLPADVISECCSNRWDKFLYEIYKPWKRLQLGSRTGRGGVELSETQVHLLTKGNGGVARRNGKEINFN